MAWDEVGKRFYETGVKNCMLYLFDEDSKSYKDGVVWNGVSAITESPSGAEASAIYADDIKYLNLYSAEELGVTIEAYTYPDEFASCDGSESPVEGVTFGQQSRKTFGLCFKTTLGNDTQGNDLGYKLHLVYGCKASPSERAYNTINDSPEAITFSWEVSTTPVSAGDDFKPTSLVTIDSTKVNAAKLAALEATLYGSEGTKGTLPLPSAVVEALAS